MLCALAAPAGAGPWDLFGTMGEIERRLSGYEALPGAVLDCGGALPPMTGQPLSLANVIDRALCANPRIRQTWGVARFRAAQAGGARAADMPTLSLNGQWNKGSVATEVDGLELSSKRDREQRNLTAALDWVLYDSGLRAGNIAVADATLRAAVENQRTTILLVLREAGQAYYDWRAAQGVLSAAREAEAVAARAVEFARARLRLGSATVADRLQAETGFAQTVVDRVEAESGLATARATLALLMATDAESFPERVDAEAERPMLANASLPSMTEAALARNPANRGAKAQLETAQARVRVAEASSGPVVALVAGYVRSRQLGAGIGQSFSTAVPSGGLQFSVPLFDGGAEWYQRYAALSQVQVGVEVLDQAVRLVEMEVWKVYHEMNKEAEKQRYGKSLLASALESNRAAELRYQAGAGNLLDLLNSRNALATARKQLVQSAAAWRTARLRLVFLSAQPLRWEPDDEEWVVHVRR